MLSFGNELKMLRKASGVSLRQMSEIIEIPAIVLGSYERGDREPGVNKYNQVLSFYGKRLVIVDVAEPYRSKSVIARTDEDLANDLEDMANYLRNNRV